MTANPDFELQKQSRIKNDIEQPASAAQLAAHERSVQLKTLVFFLLWFVLSVGFNIYNKSANNVLHLPWLLALSQFAIGVPYFVTLWVTGVRATPVLTFSELVTLFPIGVFHFGTHLGGVLSMSAGTVSFAHIIKAGEPFITSILSAVFLREIMAWQVYATLIPIVFGIAMASLHELNFSWSAFGLAMMSNLCSSLRGVYSKQKLQKPIGKNMTAPNLYAILTLISIAISLPLTLYFEGGIIKQNWVQGMTVKVAFEAFISGFCYYMYNEVAFMTLNLVSPVTHAVGSTFKRVFVIGSSIIRFGEYPSALGWVGIVTAIVGVGMYSFVKQKFKPGKH